MLPGQMGRVIASHAGSGCAGKDHANLGHILLCVGFGNHQKTVVDLTQHDGNWDQGENDNGLVELLPVGTEAKLTVEV